MRSQLVHRLEETKLGRQYTRLAQQVRRSHEELDHFVRALSHDMSANFMLLDNSFSQLKRALDLPTRPDLAELAGHVDACLLESRRFLNDLVGFARTGQADMEPTWVNLADVVDEVIYEQRQPLAQRRVEVDIVSPLPQVWCNRHRLKQVVSNLVRNALKHGCDPAQPRITIASSRDDNLPGRTNFWVHDNGPGIPLEYHDEIFLPGRRLPTALSEGSGMGLAIVRKIVEHYGGSVVVDADCAAGTSLFVSLPEPADRPLTPRLGDDASTNCLEGGDRCLERDAAHESQPLHPHQAFP